MIYISAQPDEVYFLWQLELQLFNFHSVGIGNDSIHILVGYNPEKGIHPQFKKFADNHKEIQIYFYPDKRKKKKYLSSIRPHLLAQHFTVYRSLEEETIFYHDSDILFTGVPNWDELCQNEVWYVSDTRSYLDSRYFRRFVDDDEFIRVCGLLSLTPDDVEPHDENAGGAQYILKKCTAEFWKKIEEDCELLFTYLYNEQKHGTRIQEGLQIWCTDMWVMWWNAILLNRDFRIHPLLNFCWADSPVKELDRNMILHYTGNENREKSIFDKTRYKTHSPFYVDLSNIQADNCSWFVIQLIRQYRELLDCKRSQMPNSLFLLVDRGHAEIAEKYYRKYWNVDIRICKQCEISKILVEADYKHVYVLPTNRIIPLEEMKTLKSNIDVWGNVTVSCKLQVHRMDSLGIHVFSQILEDDYLTENLGKTILVPNLEKMVIQSKSDTEFLNKELILDVYGL